MTRWIKGSEAKKKYNIPDRVYRQACHGLGAVGHKPGGVNGHWVFDEAELKDFLDKKFEGRL